MSYFEYKMPYQHMPDQHPLHWYEHFKLPLIEECRKYRYSYTAFPDGCWDSAVSTAMRLWAARPKNCGLIPSRGKRYISLQSIHTGCRPTQPLNSVVTEPLFQGLKQSVYEADHSIVVPELRMSEAILPLPYMPSCYVSQGKINFTLTPWLYAPLTSLASFTTDPHSSLSFVFCTHFFTCSSHKTYCTTGSLSDCILCVLLFFIQGDNFVLLYRVCHS